MKIIKSIYNFLKEKQNYIRKFGLILGFGILIRQIIVLSFNFKIYLLDFETLNYVLISFFFILLALIMQIISWKLIMNLLDINIPIIGAILGYMLSFLPKYIPGTIWGYLSRNEWLKNEYKVDKYLTTIGSILEIFLIIVSIINLLFIYISITMNNFLFLLITIFILFFSYYLIKIVLNNKRFIKIRKTRKIKISIKFWIFGFITETTMWILYGASVYFLIINNSNFNWFYNILYSTISFSLSWFIGFLIVFIPSGIGVREEIFANLLNYHFQLSYINTLGVAIIFRVLISLGELFLSSLGFLKKKFYRNLYK